MVEKLFYREGLLCDFLNRKKTKIETLINEIPREQFLASSDQEILNSCLQKNEILPIILHEEQITMHTPDDTQVDVSGNFLRGTEDSSEPVYFPGTEIIVEIPTAGSGILWHLTPDSKKGSFPTGNIIPAIKENPTTLILTLKQPNDVSFDDFKPNLDSMIELIRFYISSQKDQIEEFIKNLNKVLIPHIQDRRKILQKQNEIGGILGIPLKKDMKAPSFVPIPIKKHIIQPLLSPPTVKEGKRELGIFEDDYQNILRIIGHWGRTVERSSQKVKNLNEEDFRDFILASLNCIYPGQATGETFSKKGKTDIFLSEETKAAFIAECKIWRGEKEALAAVDQLLKYPTWRDCKTALIFFNKKVAGFAGLLQQIPLSLSKHTNFIENQGEVEHGEWNFVFSANEDKDRKIRVRVQVFNFFEK